MKRQLLILLTLTAVLVCTPLSSADAAGGFVRGKGHGHGFGRGLAFGCFDDDSDFADLYRELLRNVPYFALHPPVYYSYPVPRTYGYSPFAYPPSVLTPEVAGEPLPLEIINPHVPQETPAEAVSDRTATTDARPEPLVITNPYVTPKRAVARN